MKKRICALLFIVSPMVLANGDPAAGEAKAATCAACHGVKGKSAIPGYPHLAGQDYAYLVAQLRVFKSGERKGGNAAVMAPMAASLSEQDMKDLAAFYSQLQ